ncbi:WD40 repeat protein [Algoriphagus sp. 4150]|uniref:DUF3748 domain-containing protein n=1 Tax=Algoriphagus sp. 4150 TaxID=2817756 RepID=UPI00285DAB5A|nr:DUF3748 domain-containing protein [Algoriphagus sp. 4150]MDR7130901.1 WD40 repeat protein [Algoriphagus sp. 4150]
MDKEIEGSDTLKAKEIQMTFGHKGHFLNQRQAFSPDDKYLVFDNRNDDSKIGENGTIQLVNVGSGEIQTIYKLENQTNYGPGVGAASFHPERNEVVFIHGLKNASAEIPYGVTRRFAMQVDLNNANSAQPMDARDVTVPFTKGAMRGGTHAYSYSADGPFVSFTYNDAILEGESKQNHQVQDLRTVGVFVLGKPVFIEGEKNEENFDGNAYAILLAKVKANPQPGSDEIAKAYEECWVGTTGSAKPNGKEKKVALAFLGDVVSSSGEKVTEVFIADIPENILGFLDTVNAGSTTELPSVPGGVEQRRLTFTTTNKYPGVQGPRQWLRSSPDGNFIYFYQKDDAGIVQIFSVSPNGGEILPITTNDFSADTSFSLSSDGKYLAYGAAEAMYVTRVADGMTMQVLAAPTGQTTSLSNINWSNSGYRLAYNRKVGQGDQAFFQIFTLNLSTLVDHYL